MKVKQNLTRLLAGSLVSVGAVIGSLEPISAQIVPGDTLGDERSRVTRVVVEGVEVDVIDQGARRGQNLFHSFEQFDVEAGLGAYFANPVGVQSIFSRITGGDRSEIRGVLGILGDADLYFINPNGVLFGSNSSLDLSGSLTVTSADALQFGRSGEFSATAPELPSPLLRINPSAFLFNQVPTGDIVVRSTTPIIPELDVFGLFMFPGESLALLGNDVRLAGGRLNVFGGHVGIGAVEDTGQVSFNTNGNFVFPDSLRRGDVTFTDAARADVSTLASGGDLAIFARQLWLTEGSLLQAGILAVDGLSERQAGTIRLDSTARVLLTQASSVRNTVFTGAIGDGGDVEVRTPVLEVRDGAQLNASTNAQGNAGNVIIQATERARFNNGFVFSLVLPGAVGEGGNIEVRTPILDALDGAVLDASTFGQGDAGDVVIRATERARFNNGDTFSRVERGAVGNGGNVEVWAPVLEVLDGAQLTTSTLGNGNAGNIIIRVSERVNFNDGLALSRTGTNAIGDGGNVEVRTPVLEVRNGAALDASTSGEGNAGDVIIQASELTTFQGASKDGQFRSAAFSNVEANAVGEGGNVEVRTPVLEVLDGAQLVASTSGEGNSGNVIIRATERVSFNRGAAFSNAEEGAIGDGGSVEVRTPVLEVLDGAQLVASTLGNGNAGNVSIHATERVTFRGTSENDQFRSSAFSSVGAGAVGDGGNVEVRAPILEVLNGAQLNVSTFGDGNAGDIIIRASELVTFQSTPQDGQPGSSASSGVALGAVGDGGNVEVRTPVLQVLGGAQLTASTFGEGNAGDVIIQASELVTFRGIFEVGQFPSGALSRVEAGADGNGGNVEVRTPVLEVLDGAQIITSTLGNGNAGDVIIRASELVTFQDNYENGQLGTAAFSSVEAGAVGDAGNVEVHAPILEVLDGAQIIASTFGEGNAGDIIIRATERVTFQGTSENGQPSAAAGSVEAGAIGNGGNVEVHAPILEVLDGARLTASTSGEGNAGNVIIRASEVAFQGTSEDALFRSGAFSSAVPEAIGSGGNITIDTTNLSVRDAAVISAQSEGTGPAGDINLQVEDSLTLTDRSAISTQSSIAPAGNIRISVGDTLSATNSNISTSALESSGGDISLRAGDVRLLGDSDISTNSGIDGGNIALRANSILAFDDSDILAFAGEQGGDIRLNTPAFFGNGFTLASLNADPNQLDGNDRVDINATGAVSTGTVTLPDLSFLQNSLANLPEDTVDTEALLASSCVTRTDDGSTFVVTGAGGLPERPGEGMASQYSLSTVRVTPTEESPTEPSWQPGDPIDEPQGMYQLPDGRLILSQECTFE